MSCGTLNLYFVQNCLLCNLANVESGTINKNIGERATQENSIEDKKLFCKLFNISHVEKEFDPGNVGPFCQFCLVNVTELCNVEKQLCELKIRFNQIQLQIANCVVNSFAYTSCNQNNYLVKRQIYECWFERCHQNSGNIYCWDSIPMPPAPNIIIPKTPISSCDTNSSNELNIRLVPVEQLISEKTNNLPEVDGNIHNSLEHENDTVSSGDEPEIVFEPEVPVMPLPCVIKRVKRSKLNKDDKKGNKASKKHKKSAKKKHRHIRKPKESKQKLSNDLSDAEYFPPSPLSGESSPQLSPASRLYAEDPQLLDMTRSNPSEIALNNEDKTEKSFLQVPNIPTRGKNKIINDDKKSVKIRKKKPGPCKMDPDRFICPYCKKKFNQKCNFNVHVRTHTGETPHKCKICGKGFNHQGNVMKHEMTHDNTRFNGDPMFKCEPCGRKFYMASGLNDHMRRYHDPTKPTHFSPSKCELCGTVLRSSSQLEDHMKRVHTVTDKRPVKCPVCQIVFRDDLYIQMHQSVHTSEDLFYQCIICRRGLKKRSKLNWHLSQVHKILEYAKHTAVKPKEDCVVDFVKSAPEPKIKPIKEKKKRGKKPNNDPNWLTCDICKKVSQSHQSHLVHMRSHTGERPHKCKYCERTFNDQGNMKKHEATHDQSRLSGEPKYECKLCDKKYFLAGTLYHHSRIKHSEVLPKCYDKVQCEVCKAILYSRKNLVVHMRRRHTAHVLKPFQCTKCMKCFLNEEELKIHDNNHIIRTQIIQTDEFKCVHCPTIPFRAVISFTKEKLEKHYAKKHSEIDINDIPLKPLYQCPKCPLKYSLKSEIVKHNIKVHENKKSSGNNRTTKKHNKKLSYNDTDDSEFEEYDYSSEEEFGMKKLEHVNDQYKTKSSKRKLPVRNSTRVAIAKSKTEGKNKLTTNTHKAFAHFNLKQLRIILHKIDANNDPDYLIDIKEELVY